MVMYEIKHCQETKYRSFQWEGGAILQAACRLDGEDNLLAGWKLVTIAQF